MYEIAYENPARRRPPPIDRSYPRWRQMQADMKRYYETCMAGKAKGYRGARRKNYCARVSWMILRKTGRYRGYPAFRRPAEHYPIPRRRAAEMMETSMEQTRYNPHAIIVEQPGFLDNPLLFEEKLTPGAQMAIVLGGLAVLGVGAYFLLRPKPAAAAGAAPAAPSGTTKIKTGAPTADITAAFGPYNRIANNTVQPNGVYLFSAPAQTDLQTAVNNISNAGYTVYESWDVGTIPPSWPIEDADTSEQRFVLQYNGTVPLNIGNGNLYGTNGSTV